MRLRTICSAHAFSLLAELSYEKPGVLDAHDAMITLMPTKLQDRVERLENAALRFEGALFALHDLIAHSLARMPETELRRTVASLTTHATELDEALGTERIAGYREELASVMREIEHARGSPKGLLGKFRRA